jgi:hypothetical protein
MLLSHPRLVNSLFIVSYDSTGIMVKHVNPPPQGYLTAVKAEVRRFYWESFVARQARHVKYDCPTSAGNLKDVIDYRFAGHRQCYIVCTEDAM